MNSFIWFDFKKRMKSSRTVFIVLLIIILSFLKIDDHNNKSLRNDSGILFKRGKEIETIAKTGLNAYIRQNADKLDENIINSYKLMENIGIQMQSAVKNSNFKEYNRLSSIGKILICKKIAMNENRLREMSLKKQVNDIWIELSNGISYDEVYFEYTGKKGELHFYYMFLIETKHDYMLYKENLSPIDPYYIDSITFLYMYFNDVLPLILAIIIIILIFDSVNSEWISGSQKFVLSNIFSRNKYLISKVLVGILYSICIVILPALIISVGYGLFDGVKNYNYPVLYLKDGFKTLPSIPNYIEFDIENLGYNGSVGLSLYSGYPKGEMGVINGLVLISLYRFLSISLILTILYVSFLVILNTLISSITRNRIISFILSFVITIGGVLISKPRTLNENINLSPFSMNNSVRILNGTYNVTAIVSIMVLIGACLLLLLFTLYLFKNKDI